MKTLLFDIDGTLLMTNNSGSGALKHALEEEFSLTESQVDLDFSGRTDRSILDELLTKNGLEPSFANRQRLQNRYQYFLPSILSEFGGSLLPGVIPLLERLSQRPHLHSFVMTGNLVATAHLKLKHFEIHGFFRDIFGGDHDADRNDLARRAREDLQQRFPKEAKHDLVVIGDTVADIHCARAIDAKVIAVASGTHDQTRLASAEPDVLLGSLEDTEAVLASIDQ